MNIAYAYTVDLDKGLDKDDHDSAVYFAKYAPVGYGNAQTLIIAGREASLLTILLSGRKLKELSGAEISGLFVQE